MAAALEAIDAIADSITGDNVDAIVWELEKTFKSVYDRHALSAASKLLWIRHRSPVVIYDGQACKTLKRLGSKFKGGNYKAYRGEWMRQFADHESGYSESLRGTSSRQGVLVAHDMPDSELAALAAERWFHERVFDNFLWRTGAA